MEGRFNEGFFASPVWGLIFGGDYTWRDLFSEFYGIQIHYLVLLALAVPHMFSSSAFAALGNKGRRISSSLATKTKKPKQITPKLTQIFLKL